MNVTEAKFKDRQLQRKGHLQKVSAEQKEYAEASACRRIAESTDIITDLQTAGLLEKILHRDNCVPSPKKQTKNAGEKTNEKNDKYDIKLLYVTAFIPRFA